jgi:hypothetical protein
MKDFRVVSPRPSKVLEKSIIALLLIGLPWRLHPEVISLKTPLQLVSKFDSLSVFV